MSNRIVYRELIKIIKKFGVKEDKKRGKGSHRMLYQKSTDESFTIPYHGDNRPVSWYYINRMKERFNIPDDAF